MREFEGKALAAAETDQQLVERVQAGDKRAFDLLVMKYQAKILALVSRYVKDSHEVQDVTQEAFIKAYRALPRFRGDSAFYTWLYRIAINTAKNHLVSRGRRPPGSDVEIEDAEHFESGGDLRDLENPENQLFGEELKAVVDRAITELPDDLRAAVTLREFDGLSYEDIADIMDCPVGTVRSRIFRAREAIDKQVRAQLDGEPLAAPEYAT
ncbi:MAG: RNA polymerase sigma factor RpoE [Pseudomonadota bacterium]